MTTVTYALFDGKDQVPIDAYGRLTSVLGDEGGAMRNIAYAVGSAAAHLRNNPELSSMQLSIQGAVTGGERRTVQGYMDVSLMHLYNRTRDTDAFSWDSVSCILTINRIATKG